MTLAEAAGRTRANPAFAPHHPPLPRGCTELGLQKREPGKPNCPFAWQAFLIHQVHTPTSLPDPSLRQAAQALGGACSLQDPQHGQS
ncbi:5-hydroxytryptamine receptor 3E [Manis javanica]|nr:5-hydroxytryptamine receptor 3E [Manis javanica]